MIIVIGGGPAGRMAALRLAGSGKKVTIIEKRKIGGQCVFDGCMLICGLNDAARALTEARHMQSLGVFKGNVEADYPHLLDKLANVQSKLSHIIEKETRDAGAEIEYGKTAEFRDGKVFVDGVQRDAEAVIIAGGADLKNPDIPGITLANVYTPRSIRTMRTLPKRMVIVGGGISGAEFAYIYAAFGVEVTLIARSKVLSVLPESLRKDALRDLKNVHVEENTAVERIEGDTKAEAVIAGGRRIPCDAVLVCAGFTHEISWVSGLDRNPDGSIRVDETMQTSCPGVYAAGDICGAPYFTPAARMRGFAAADAVLGNPHTICLEQQPFTVVLGLDYTVCPAKEQGKTIESYNIAGPGAFWHVADSTVGHMQITVSEDKKVLGFASSSPSGGVLGTYLGHMVRRGLYAEEFLSLLEVHPLPDGLYSLIRFSA
ncbi:MAG TPA: NAD(P)/FAD-dependent oxidoreductase [Methanocorpusculum sp.]|nr:NAD(P)/FAD-dependent oxidoreductase [Methanocorpusculum sp.]